MKVIELSKSQVRELYEKSMMVDFPEDERKPLSMIEDGMDNGVYECLGLSEDGEILGYTFFIRMGNDYLFDYFAILEKYRNRGVGSFMLQEIAKHYAGADSVIGEVEDFTLAKSEEERILQKRRYQFYLRNGYVDTTVRAKMFGVDFIIIEMGGLKKHTREEIMELYERQYRTFLPKGMYEKMIVIKE